MKRLLCLLLVLAESSLVDAAEAPKKIHVFVCLADNAHQGLVPVPPKIGNGDDAENNLYWGCDEALPQVLAKSKGWKRTKTEATPSEFIIERRTFEATSGRATLIAEAYRGSQMKVCLEEFEKAIRSGESDLIAFIGHNGLMDMSLTLESATPVRRADVIVLCCESDRYFGDRITSQGGRPLLLTTQLMYPGGFILRDAIATWLAGGDGDSVRLAAAKAYATNQSISVKSASGVFVAPSPK